MSCLRELEKFNTRLKFFDVDYILRIGSCGSTNEDVKVLDVVLS